MEINDVEFAKLLQEIIKKEVKKQLNNYNGMKTKSANVVAVNGDGTINVNLTEDSITILTNIKNKTNVTLSVGDNIYLYLPTGSLTGCYAGIKF